jgi:hypothetical protein
MLRRVLAVLVIMLVAVLAIRLAVGIVVGFVSAVLWIAVLVALIAAVLWARSVLKGGKRKREVDQPSTRAVAARPTEDPIEAEMRKITEQLREQGRGR